MTDRMRSSLKSFKIPLMHSLWPAQRRVTFTIMCKAITPGSVEIKEFQMLPCWTAINTYNELSYEKLKWWTAGNNCFTCWLPYQIGINILFKLTKSAKCHPLFKTFSFNFMGHHYGMFKLQDLYFPLKHYNNCRMFSCKCIQILRASSCLAA